MPQVETVEELAEAIADMLGIYCEHDDPEDHDQEYGDCRIDFCLGMQDRIRAAVRNEKMLEDAGA